MDERTDEGKKTGKEEWLATAGQFFHDGDFNGMRACPNAQSRFNTSIACRISNRSA